MKTNNVVNNNRKPEFDMIKGVVIILVMFIHFSELTGIFGVIITNPNYIHSTGVLLMLICFICSGYLYSAKGSVISELLKKIKQLILPCIKFSIFFSIIYFLRYVIIERKTLIWYFDNMLTNILGFVCWNVRLNEYSFNQMLYAFIPYWFIIQLFVGMCLFIPIILITKEKKVYIRVIIAIFLLAVAMLCNYFDVQHTLEMTFTSNVSYYFVLINIFGIAALLMIGNVLKELNIFDFDNHKKICKLVMFVSAILVLVIYYVLYLKNVEIGGYALQWGKWGPLGCISIPMATISSISFMLFLMYIFRYLKKLSLIKNLLCFLGQNTLDILLIHYGIAEIIMWLGGFWYKFYFDSPIDNFSFNRCFITIVGTLVIVFIFILVKMNIKNK